MLTGVGNEAFIGGANIGQMSEFPDHVAAEAGSKTTHHACDSIRRVPVPVIARIEGYCLGAGMEIATACDMRVASTNAVFGMPEVKYGVPSGMEACLIPRLMTWGKAMELVYTGEHISAEEAYHFGCVEKLVAPEEIDAQTERWVRSICEAGPRAIRIQKALCRIGSKCLSQTLSRPESAPSGWPSGRRAQAADDRLARASAPEAIVAWV